MGNPLIISGKILPKIMTPADWQACCCGGCCKADIHNGTMKIGVCCYGTTCIAHCGWQVDTSGGNPGVFTTDEWNEILSCSTGSIDMPWYKGGSIHWPDYYYGCDYWRIESTGDYFIPNYMEIAIYSGLPTTPQIISLRCYAFTSLTGSCCHFNASGPVRFHFAGDEWPYPGYPLTVNYTIDIRDNKCCRNSDTGDCQTSTTDNCPANYPCNPDCDVQTEDLIALLTELGVNLEFNCPEAGI